MKMKKNLNMHESAIVGENFTHEYNVVIYEDVEIGDNVSIGNNVVIYPGTVIGDDTSILDNAILGRPPKLGSRSTRKPQQLAPLKLGKGVIVGSGATVFRGCELGDAVYIGDNAHVREKCILGKGTSIGKLVSLQENIKIGMETKIMSCSQIAENSTIGDHVFIGADVSTCADPNFGRIKGSAKEACIKDNAMIGSNCTIAPGITIGENAVVALGAAVFKNVPAEKVALGNPAKVVWNVDKKLLR